MPTYTFACPVHGRMDITRPANHAGWDQGCPRCYEEVFDPTRPLEERNALLQRSPFLMRRIYNQQRRAIVRPRGYNLRPGERDPTVPGLAYSNFAHELARGELTEDATPVYTPESRARREAELAAEDERPPAMAAIDRDIPERAHQELHEWARAAYSRLEEERRYA